MKETDKEFIVRIIKESCGQMMAFYTVKYLTYNDAIKIRHTEAPLQKESVKIAIENVKKRKDCKKVIGVVPKYETDSNKIPNNV